MKFEIESRHLSEIVVVKPSVFKDSRGSFSVLYHRDMFAAAGLPTDLVQDNWSHSKKGVVRGLHFQWDPQMGKLMCVIKGRAFLVAVDIRKKSPTLGQYYGLEISSDDPRMVWAPPGFARGFCALSDEVELHYKCSGMYNPRCESAIRWNDPDIGIQWPIENPTMSDRDAAAQSLSDWLKTPQSNIFQ